MNQITLKIGSLLKRTNSFNRFLIVGVINTLLGLSIIFTLLNLFHLSYWVSTFIGNGLGAILSFILNRTFTFRSSVNVKTGFIRFILVILVCYFGSYALSISFSTWLLEKVSLLGYIMKDELAILIGAGLYTISNYLGQKFFVFK